MKQLVGIVVVFILLVMGFYILLTREQHETIGTNMDAQYARYSNSDIQADIEFRTSPDGYVLSEVEIPQFNTSLLKKVELKTSSSPQNGTPFMTISVYRTDEKDVMTWLSRNEEISHYKHAFFGTHEADIEVDGGNGLQYVSTSGNDSVVLLHGDRVYLFVRTDTEKSVSANTDFKDVVSRTKFK